VIEPLKTLFDVRRQHLERTDIQFLARLFNLFEIDLHECTFTKMKNPEAAAGRCARADRPPVLPCVTSPADCVP
jgi:hypothetical protein